MSQVIHWSLIIATAAVVYIEVWLAWSTNVLANL
jgi:hypothetical protein